MRVFIRNQPVLFVLDLPKRPTQSTDWSGWSEPMAYQEDPLPEDARQGLSLRYRFRLIAHGVQ
ncbi:MAG: hypothetical protein LH606_06390 [Cytophagaceae bacterium]|nr:hypothetical protein [Cytophagaceae bacterium]